MSFAALAVAAAPKASAGALGGVLQAGTDLSGQLALGAASGSSAVKIFLLVTALSFASALILSLTSFTRIIIVLSFLRQALGTPQLPPNPVLMGLSLFLTMFIMAPVATRVNRDALSPYLDDKISASEALERGEGPLRDWMLKQTRAEDLRLFLEISGEARPARGEALSMTVVIPAFMISELGTSFRMGLFIFVPMLLIDILVASILMSLGMMMVPPQMISLPLKIGVFLLAGGWHLVVSSLVRELLMGDLPGALTREGFMLLATTAGPVIGALLVIGLAVGIFQAATQINDPAVGFLPRFAAAILAVWLLGGWLLERYATFFATSLHRMSQR